MNSRAIGGLVAAAVAGIVGCFLVRRFLDREMPEVAQFPDNEPVEFTRLGRSGEVTPEDKAMILRRLQETVDNPELRERRGWRPQRHEDPLEYEDSKLFGDIT